MKNKILKIVFGSGILLALSLLFIPGLASAARTGVQSVSGYFTTSPTNSVNIYYNSGSVGIGTSAPTSNGLSVVGLATSSRADIIKVASSTGALYFTISDFGTTTVRQYQGFGVPTFSTSTGIGMGAGTTTVSAGSTDLAGTIIVVTGSVPAINTTIFTATMGSSTGAYCVVSPSSKTSAQLGVASSTFITNNALNWTMTSGDIGLLSTTTYRWNYLCN